jgi:PiT family inorganic phosphate transporter
VALTLLLLLIAVALAFEFINGFHDTANSIATVVATKVLTPTQAVGLAAVTNLIGAMMGEAVAKTVSSGLIDSSVVTVTSTVLICALLAAIVWNLVTWWWGLPSSSTHALIGGLCGAAIAASGGKISALVWAQPADPWYKGSGLLYKIVVPMLVSPVAGFMLGVLIMGVLFATVSGMSRGPGWMARLARPRWMNAIFGKLQLVSASYMGFAHGLNDAQKTMGIIALALIGAQTVGTLDNLPAALEFMRPDPNNPGIALWIKVTCALIMAAGTAVGGWRIIKTMGHKMVKLHPVHGFAAETASATILSVAASLGMPVSTTHSISTAIMGVGFAKRANALRWTVVERIVWAWVFTIPVAALLAYALVMVTRMLGMPH